MLEIEGKEYELEYDDKDPYAAPGLAVAFCAELAGDFVPVIFDPYGYGSRPYAPDLVAYRILVDLKAQRLCVLYEVYWRRQDCSWREFNKDHDHDYEQIQLHFNLKTGKKEKVIISSVGPAAYAGHGVEVYRSIAKASARDVAYTTSSGKWFPWGGKAGEVNFTQVKDIPLESLFFEGKRVAVLVVNCYHAFTGLKRELLPEERIVLNPPLVKLDGKLLDIWYFRNAKNRFGHDISKLFEEPHVMYYPPPEDGLSRFVYGVLWVFYSAARIFRSLFENVQKEGEKKGL